MTELIRSARRQRNLSQRGLAAVLVEVSDRDTVTRSDVSRWERGKRIPTGDRLYWLSQVLHIPEDVLRRATREARQERAKL